MSSTPPQTVNCRFYRRTKVDGGHRYDRIYIGAPDSSGTLATPHPPAVGDVLFLAHALDNAPLTGHYEVIAREWRHASWGSGYWPILEPFADEGPALYVIVKPAASLMADEVADGTDG